MALESLKNKLASLPGSSAAPQSARVSPVPRITLGKGPSEILPDMRVSQSTPAVATPGTGLIPAAVAGLKLLNPFRTTERRPIFAPAGQTAPLGGGNIVGLLHDITARTIEAIPAIALTTVANYKQIDTGNPEESIKVPFDISRLGLSDVPGKTNVQNSFDKMDQKFRKLELENPDRTGTNIALAALSPMIDALDAFAAGEIFTSVARAGLKGTNYSPELNKAIQQYGMQDVAGEDLTTELTRRFNQKAKKLIEAGDNVGLDELGRATNVILTNMTGKGIPQLNAFGRFIQTLSRTALQDARKGLKLQNPLASELAPEARRVGLPGDVYDEPRGLVPFGLSTRRVRRVGGAEEQPAGGPFFRSREGGKSFEPVDEGNVMPAPIRQDLDTFVAKTNDGYAVIEGKTGQQLGDTEKTMAAAISSAKNAIAGMPDGALDRMIDESPLSPRYEQLSEEAPKTMALDIPKSKKTPETAEAAAADYYEARIKPEIAKGNAFAIGADDMKDYFGSDYLDKNHPIYSKGSFELYERALKENKGSVVRLTGGGPGAGKTENLVKPLSQGFDGIIYDSNLSNYEGALKQIQMAKDAGKKVEIWGMLPDLDMARRHTILRKNRTGRGISDKTFARGHAGFPEVLKKLLENKIINPEDVHLYDLRGFDDPMEAFKKISLGIEETNPIAVLQKLKYNEDDIRDAYGETRFNKETGERLKESVRDVRGSREPSEVPAPKRTVRKEADAERGRDAEGVGGDSQRKVKPRENRKLAERVAEATSFDDFYKKSGLTLEALDATARAKGFENAKEYYDAQKALTETPADPARSVSEDESLQLLSEQGDDADYFISPSEAEEARIVSNLERTFAALKGVSVKDLKTKFTQADIDQARLHYEMVAENLVDHPGRALQKFLSRKEGDFLDLKDPKTAKNARERDRIVDFNRRVMVAAEKAFEGTKWFDMFDDPDTIRQAIADYQKLRKGAQEIQDSFRSIAKEIRISKQAGRFVAATKDKLARETARNMRALKALVDAATKTGYRSGLKEGSKRYDTLVSNLRNRRRKILALQEAYQLTDTELRHIRREKYKDKNGKTKYRDADPRFMTKEEFDRYYDGVERAAQNMREIRQERNIVNALIREGDFNKLDNLRKAMQFPRIDKMNVAQLKAFGDQLAKTAPGDTFLGPRMIQTAGNTELGKIRTYAEGRKAVAEKLGLKPEDVQETADADVFLDSFLRDPAWADRDPLRKMIVLDYTAGDIARRNKVDMLRTEIEKLATEARKSRRKKGGILGTLREKIFGRLANTDEMVAKYMETLPDGLPALEKRMTPEEIKFGKFGRDLMQKYYQYAVDDANQRWSLAGVRNSRFKDMYLPHMGPKFFERWKDNGFVGAVKSIFDGVQETGVDFNAFGDRGEILGFEKFLKNNQTRENLKAKEYSKNVANILMSYSDAFEKKILLDSQIPKIKLLEQILGRKYRTPKSISNPDGAEKVSSALTRTLNEWVNKQKGQKVETLRIKQGSQMEKFLQSTNILISIMDLGGNLVTQTASGVGGELFNVLSYARGGGGAKGWLLGHGRAMRKQGRKLARENPGVIGVRPWVELANAFNDAGQTLIGSLFYLFADLAYRARRQLFLGSLTKQEYRSGIISPKRLAEIKLKVGKVHPLPEFRSVQGNTALMQLANKYMEWAIPNFQTSAGILTRVVKDAKTAYKRGGKAGAEEFFKSRAYKDAAITAFVGIGAYALGQIVFAPEDGDKSVIGKWRAKAAREMASILQSATGIGVFGSSRAMDMLEQLQNVIKLTITLERYKRSGPGYEAGDLKFPNAMERLITPGLIRQLQGEEKKESAPEGSRGDRTSRSRRARPQRAARKPRVRRRSN